MIARRRFLCGLLAAPAIVSVASLMPLRGRVLREYGSLYELTWFNLFDPPSRARSIMEAAHARYLARELGRPLTAAERAGWEFRGRYHPSDGVYRSIAMVWA